MKADLLAMTALLACCVLLTACDDAGVLKINIDTPTTEASFSTTESELLIGGTASHGGYMGHVSEVYATNLRTGRRYEADYPAGSGTLRWHVLIPDLQLGDNEIIATVLTANDYKETRITIVRNQ